MPRKASPMSEGSSRSFRPSCTSSAQSWGVGGWVGGLVMRDAWLVDGWMDGGGMAGCIHIH